VELLPLPERAKGCGNRSRLGITVTVQYPKRTRLAASSRMSQSSLRRLSVPLNQSLERDIHQPRRTASAQRENRLGIITPSDDAINFCVAGWDSSAGGPAAHSLCKT
jgi:hypothetical protein